MNRDLTPEECVILESLVDSACLSAVARALSTICGEKADHIRASYGEKDATARLWDTAAGVIGIGIASCDVSQRLDL